jgi:hypothetical protein
MDERRIENANFAFQTRDGARLESVKDLYGHLSAITDEAFAHHVQEGKNDFASWVEHAHNDKFLAAAIRRAKTKEEMRKMIFVGLFR